MTQSSHQHLVDRPDEDTIQLVQLTDCHLGHMPGNKLLGMDTDHSLQAVIDMVKAERSQVDFILATGDLSDHGACQAYERLQSYFQQFPCRSFWLPGNHDDRGTMASVAGSRNHMVTQILAGNWQILMLDSQIPGEVGGRLGESELAALEAGLERVSETGQFSLICLHHQPVRVGCDWLDQQMVDDAEQFWRIIERFPGVKGVLWGHVHQQIDTMRGDVALMASPSTCVQFAPNSVDFKADDQPPGYRWLDLAPNGEINTGVSRVRNVRFEVDFEMGGYL